MAPGMRHSFSVDAEEQQGPAAAPSPHRSFGLGALAGFAGVGLLLVALSSGDQHGPGRAAKFLGGGAALTPQLGRAGPAISPQRGAGHAAGTGALAPPMPGRSRIAHADVSLQQTGGGSGDEELTEKFEKVKGQVSDQFNDKTAGLQEGWNQRVKIFKESQAAGASNKQLIADVIAGEYDVEAVKAEMNELINSAPAVMFTWEASPSCKKAVTAFEDAGAEVKIVRLDNPWSKGNTLRAELGKKVGRTSVPFIFFGGEYVGGFDGGVSDEAPGIQSMAFKGTLLPTLAAIGAMKPKVPLAAETPAPETTAAPETTPAAKEDDVPPPPPDVLPPPPPAP